MTAPLARLGVLVATFTLVIAGRVAFALDLVSRMREAIGPISESHV